MTSPPGDIGQGAAHLQFAFAAHRVVADVDAELGLVRLVEVTTAQDVGKALNPLSVVGQIQGGTTQGHRPGADGGDPGARTARSATRPSPTT